MNGVKLNVVPTTKFKNTSITVDFIQPLDYHQFADQAIVSELMETSNQDYPKQSQLAKQLSRMYGAGFGTDVLKYGNLHISRLVISFPNEQYLPTKESTFKMALDFLKSVIFKPLATDGQFNATTFELQQQNTINYVKTIPDDKQFYSVNQLKQLYYQGDLNYAGLVFGTVDQLKATTAKSAYDAYLAMVEHAQVQISVLGNVDEATVTDQIKTLGFQPRPEMPVDAKVKRTPTEDVTKKAEVQKLNQSKLDMAYSLPIYYDQPIHYAALLFNALFGGTPQSKLFRNVREKHSLAYYADSTFSSLTGLLMVQTGINSADYQKVIDIVNDQLVAIQHGDFDAEIVENIKADLINSRLASLDSQRQLLNQQLVEGILNRHTTVDEWCDNVRAVTKEDIISVSKQVQLQSIYFLDGRDDIE
ncbi:EF-P 5-aminopentanol modification-associated protein YfmF [Nicoliella lavandulae]|uniref:Pitrilysin family protein n=1 Tax=Nicoliella lavandulae TaxID=3082954 RepID=A0ABU8SKG7_9LACO